MVLPVVDFGWVEIKKREKKKEKMRFNIRMWIMLWMVLLALCSRCKARAENKDVDVTLPNHVAVEDIAFIHFAPEQIDDNPWNASVICRIFPSSSLILEEHEMICFSDLEQYGVRLSNDTHLSCHAEVVDSMAGVHLLTPILQNSCVLHPVYLNFDHQNQHLQALEFAKNHASLCETNRATMKTCQSIDNHAYMDLLSAYSFADGNQIYTIPKPDSMKSWMFDKTINFIKYYWKLK